MSGAHSRLGASSMARWSVCPGSIRLAEQVPESTRNRSSKYAEEGTAAHELAAVCLVARKNAADFIGREFAGFVCDEEMAEAVQVYLETVAQVQQAAEPGVLVVIDYKHGRGVPVEVLNNLQLIYYAFGAFASTYGPRITPSLEVEKRFTLDSMRPDLGGTCDAIYHPGGSIHTIRVVIVQPRCAHPDGPVRAWQFPMHKLIDWRADLLEAAARTDDPNAPLVSGPHCKFCPAAAICPALEARTTALVAAEFSDLTAPGYDPEKVAKGLSMIPELEARIEALRKFAYAELYAGRKIPGYKIVAKRPTRRWKDKAAVAEAVAGLGAAAYTAPELLSPAQMEQALGGKKRAAAIIGEYIESQSSGTVLAPESDSRPAVAGVLEYFEDLQMETGKEN